MKFTLEIDLDNAAFEGPHCTQEIRLILEKVRQELQNCPYVQNLKGMAFHLCDINGNTCGKWEVK